VSAAIRPLHRDRAAELLRVYGSGDDAEYAIAQALADAEEYGIRKALHRLGPIIADAESAREQLASEVDL
jgi:hypothetical protein